jgi:prepilin-type processing-associated H-X9-DG protein
LFWDTALWHEAEPDVPSLFWQAEGNAGGYELPCGTIDKYFSSVIGGLKLPRVPRASLSRPHRRPLRSSTTPAKPQRPIAWLNFTKQRRPQPGPHSGGMYFCAFGGPRWRHNGNQSTNVAFADGSVKTLRLTSKVITVNGIGFYDNSSADIC